MKNKTTTLRTQFLSRLLIIVLLIAFISGALQLYFMKEQIAENVENKSIVLAQGIEQGMEETNLAAESIEHQIDLRLESYSKRIADELEGQPLDNITTEELVKIRDDLELTGITLFAKQEDDIVGVKSTDQTEIGFSFKKIGYPAGFDALNMLYENELVTNGATYSTKNMFVLPITQSGSHGQEPIFFKYAYYLEPDSTYIINAYLESNEIYHFIKEVGPDSWIERMKDKNLFVKEIAVLDPRVFEDPELETKLFPPLKKIVHGEYSYQDSKDESLLINMIKKPKSSNYIGSYNGEKVYKMFLPTKEGKVVYIGLDYSALSGPLIRHSLILLITGLVSLVALFLITASFFNKIYEKISHIKSQIKQLENGDLTPQNGLEDGSELGRLSESVNRTAIGLNKLVTDTQEQATKTQNLSVLLETEASQSVEKMYELSTETTTKAREQLFEIIEFLEGVEQVLQPYNDNENVEKTLGQVEAMKVIANERTSTTTGMTITLSDLLKSLHGQSSELSDISNNLLEKISKFKLN
ncbi:methyl-accepting chemotaxis protein [Bacillus solitudinis]|uniref:methyl-accepting chemotaxis protein n=1 Tax=Bacillus solitudinis TaxID=2014074 RepID=UPI000C2427AB|nr:methyl-accepting chemotaxis protein [Bacillus solitudinis]